MKVMEKYERGTHNCLEHAYWSPEGSVWRCSECLRITPTETKCRQILDKYQTETVEWFAKEVRQYPVALGKYAEIANYDSICPECESYIRKYSSRIVELRHAHYTISPEHDNGSTHDISGRYVHFDCYKAILRTRPCYYCGDRPAGTIDHIHPTSKGGEDQPYNLVAACFTCNPSKGTRNQTVYIINKELNAPDLGTAA